MNLLATLALCIIMLTIAGVAVGRYPGLRMNRATIALVGATLLVISGALSFEEAVRAIDFNTIVLLFAMMVLNINLRLAGFFRLVTAKIITVARTPRQLLALVVFTSGILSALFLNDTIVLMLTPLVVEVVLTLQRNPVPYLIAVTTAANVGSAATIVGNPQNMLIGIASGIPFVEFTARIAPVSLLGLVLTTGVIALVYRREFRGDHFPPVPAQPVRTFRPLLRKSVAAVVLMLIAFVAGAPIPVAALGAAALLLVTRRIKPERVFTELDWALLVFFSGLFIVTHAVTALGFGEQLFAWLGRGESVVGLAISSFVLSNLISNVPAVLLLAPVVNTFQNAETAWLVLAMATTFAGNFTLLASVANMIVAETAKHRGVVLSFGEFLKTGVPITLLTLLTGVLWFIFAG